MNGLQTLKKGTQLICIDTIKEYRPKKSSIQVWIHTSARGKIYKELGSGLKIDFDLPEGPEKRFEQLLVDQPAWISDLVKFVTSHQTDTNMIKCQQQSMTCSQHTTKMDT